MAGHTFNPVASLQQGLQLGSQLQAQGRNQRIQQLRNTLAEKQKEKGFEFASSPELQELAALDSPQAAQIAVTFGALDKTRQKSFFQDAQKGLNFLNAGKIEEAFQLASRRDQQIQKLGGDNSDTQAFLQTLGAGDIPGATQLLQGAVDTGIDLGFLRDPEEIRIKRISAGQREFESKLKGLPPKQKQEAILINLGLAPRAVGSAIQTISQKGIEDQIGKASAIIKQREKFAEATGVSRARTIDKGFERIGKINEGILNIDRAITLVEGGAGVGALERFLPSFKAASVGLDQIQNQMALDVIGGVTLGAISEGELALVKQVALPVGLDTPQLLQHLRDRKAAQEKLRNYFNQQIQFLDQGGTVAGFLRQQERATQQGAPQQLTQPQQPIQPGGVLRFDAQGNLIP